MTFFADVILVIHFVFVIFVVVGLFLIWIGAALGWRWVRNFWFRASHLGAICFVAAEAIAGIACPLTVWEDSLRGAGSEEGFIERWVGGILYYDFPEWVFTLAYIVFALMVALTYWLIKPEGRRV
ncbi:MAG: DUF2784 domain-containing protein [Burkholderiales bacterium]